MSLVCLKTVRLPVCLQVKEDESQEAVQIQTMLSTVGMIQTLVLF